MTDASENKDAHHEVTHLARFPSSTSSSSQSPPLQVSRSFSASRRAWVLGACAAAAALAFAGAGRSFSWVAPAFADAPASGGLDAFLALSQRLTGRTGFDAVLGKRVYDALAKSDSQFAQNVAALKAALSDHSAESALDEATHAQKALLPAMEAVRAAADTLESVVADDLWPLPTYQEMLYIL